MIRVIIIDDETMITKVLGGYLEDQGFEVATADSGMAGLARIAAEQYDIVIVDVRMPDMDGNDLVARAASLRPGMKFIMHTGSVDYRPGEELAAFGVDEDSIIRKPMHDMSEIVRMIQRKVNGGRS